MPFSVGPPGEATFCYWSFQRGHLLRIGFPRRDALFYWLPLRRHLFLLVLPEAVASSVIHKGTLCPSSGLGCRIPKMLGPCEGQPQGRGRGQWTYQLQGLGRGLGSPAWVTACLPPLSCPSPGCVHFQCCADDPSHHGKLRFSQVGPGCGLAHGPVFHGPHPGVHGLHVPHLKGLPEAGKSLLHPSCRWAPSPLCWAPRLRSWSTVYLGRQTI